LFCPGHNGLCRSLLCKQGILARGGALRQPRSLHPFPGIITTRRRRALSGPADSVRPRRAVRPEAPV
jgi:hypothetical protein